jgi:hypothetical protein
LASVVDALEAVVLALLTVGCVGAGAELVFYVLAGRPGGVLLAGGFLIVGLSGGAAYWWPRQLRQRGN